MGEREKERGTESGNTCEFISNKQQCQTFKITKFIIILSNNIYTRIPFHTVQEEAKQLKKQQWHEISNIISSWTFDNLIIAYDDTRMTIKICTQTDSRTDRQTNIQKKAISLVQRFENVKQNSRYAQKFAHNSPLDKFDFILYKNFQEFLCFPF